MPCRIYPISRPNILYVHRTATISCNMLRSNAQSKSQTCLSSAVKILKLTNSVNQVLVRMLLYLDDNAIIYLDDKLWFHAISQTLLYCMNSARNKISHLPWKYRPWISLFAFMQNTPCNPFTNMYHCTPALASNHKPSKLLNKIYHPFPTSTGHRWCLKMVK